VGDLQLSQVGEGVKHVDVDGGQLVVAEVPEKEEGDIHLKK